MSEPAAVYRLYGGRDRLLYVGATNNPESRWQCLRREHAQWWPEVAYAEVTWHSTREAALVAEAVAIRDERPARNQSLPNPERPWDGMVPADWRWVFPSAETLGRPTVWRIDDIRGLLATPPRFRTPGRPSRVYQN
jgi:hypothetical protein